MLTLVNNNVNIVNIDNTFVPEKAQYLHTEHGNGGKATPTPPLPSSLIPEGESGKIWYFSSQQRPPLFQFSGWILGILH